MHYDGWRTKQPNRGVWVYPYGNALQSFIHSLKLPHLHNSIAPLAQKGNNMRHNALCTQGSTIRNLFPGGGSTSNMCNSYGAFKRVSDWIWFWAPTFVIKRWWRLFTRQPAGRSVGWWSFNYECGALNQERRPEANNKQRLICKQRETRKCRRWLKWLWKARIERSFGWQNVNVTT